MTAAIGYVVLVVAIGWVVVGWFATEQEVKRGIARHIAQHEAAVEAVHHAPTEWPEYCADCPLCGVS